MCSHGSLAWHSYAHDTIEQALYENPVASSLWYRKLFTYLQEYGFVPLAATFLIRRKASGIVLLNVYSDDRLGATNDETLWQELMQDFKSF